MIKSLGAAAASTYDVTDKDYTDMVPPSFPAVGEWVVTPGIVGSTSVSPTSGRWTAHPAWLAPGQYDAIGVTPSTLLVSAGGTIVSKCAVSADDPTQGRHNFPLLSSYIESGTVDLTSTGGAASNVHYATFGTPWACPGGFYWLHFFYSASTTPTTSPSVACINNVSWGLGQTSAQAFTNRMRGWSRTGLTDLPTSSTLASNSSRSAASDIVTIGLRRYA